MAKQVTRWEADNGTLHPTEELAHFADAFDRFLREVDSMEPEGSGALRAGYLEAGNVRRALLEATTLALCILRVRAPHLLASGYCVETKSVPQWRGDRGPAKGPVGGGAAGGRD